MSTNKVVLFGEKAAGVYRMSDIYFPDESNPISPEQSGKIVPAVGSLVIDDTKGLHNQQYTVVAVDPNTYKPTLLPSTFSYDTSSQPDRVLNYGNDLLMLYFQKETIQKDGQALVVNRLIVDNKLSIFGNHAATYQLLKYNNNGQLQTISRWYRPNGIMAGTAIPMLDTGVEGIRKCDGCYTDIDLTEGESIVCRIYSAGGVQISELTLIAKQAHMLNELASVANPIVNMVVKSNQMLGQDLLFLYTGQNTSELTIFPHLIYSDNQDVQVAIDGLKGFVYGLEDVRTDVPGMEYRLLIKYYLGDDDVMIGEENRYVYYRTSDTTWKAKNSDNTTKYYYTRNIIGDSWVYSQVPVSSYTVGDTIPNTTEYFERTKVNIQLDDSQAIRFITKEVIVRVINLDYERASKISIIPVWDSSVSKWGVKFLKYMESMNVSPAPMDVNVTNAASYFKFGNATTSGDDASTGVKALYGGSFNTTQNVNIRYKNVVGESYVEASQKVYFRFYNKSSVTNGVNWLISDTNNANKMYGRNTDDHPRPVIYYRATATAASSGDSDATKTNYFIPSSVFHQTSNQKAYEVFLDNFYYQANPPKDPDTQQLIVPTHFVVKDIQGKVISRYDNTAVAEIPITNSDEAPLFSSMLYLKKGGNSSAAATNDYVGTTLIIEFIRRENNVDKYIYGAPVDVIQG